MKQSKGKLVVISKYVACFCHNTSFGNTLSNNMKQKLNFGRYFF